MSAGEQLLRDANEAMAAVRAGRPRYLSVAEAERALRGGLPSNHRPATGIPGWKELSLAAVPARGRRSVSSTPGAEIFRPQKPLVDGDGVADCDCLSGSPIRKRGDACGNGGKVSDVSTWSLTSDASKCEAEYSCEGGATCEGVADELEKLYGGSFYTPCGVQGQDVQFSCGSDGAGACQCDWSVVDAKGKRKWCEAGVYQGTPVEGAQIYTESQAACPKLSPPTPPGGGGSSLPQPAPSPAPSPVVPGSGGFNMPAVVQPRPVAPEGDPLGNLEPLPLCDPLEEAYLLSMKCLDSRQHRVECWASAWTGDRFEVRCLVYFITGEVICDAFEFLDRNCNPIPIDPAKPKDTLSTNCNLQHCT